MLKRKMDTNQKICKLLDTGHNTLRMEQIVVTDLSSDDWNVISKEVNDKIIYIEFCINRILKLETITFSTTSSILSKIVLRFEEVLRILSLLKLDLVYEQVHQFVDHFEQLSSELEKGIDSRISFNFLNHFISTESKSFLFIRSQTAATAALKTELFSSLRLAKHRPSSFAIFRHL